MKRVLVTGATGFIGRHCLPLLLAHGYEVHAVSSKTLGFQSTEIQWHQADLLDLQQIPRLISKIKATHLLHFAWYLAPGKYANAYENYLWVQSSLELLKQFNENSGKRVVMSGTCFEYDWNYGYCSEFVTPKAPNTFYGRCKNMLQLLLNAYSDNVNLSSAWGRIFFLYGEYEYPTRLVASVIRSILQGEPALSSHGKQIRDFLYVQDVADAFVTLLESEVSGPVNIASGRPIALKDIINKIAKILNREDLVRLGALPPAANDTHLVVADVGRLFDEVGWQPKHDLDSGLQQTIEWWKNQLNSETN